MNEFEIMQKIDDLIKDQEDIVKKSILSWVVTKYGLRNDSQISSRLAAPNQSAIPYNQSQPQEVVGSTRDLAEEFAQYGPRTDKDKALFVASFLQTAKGQDTFSARNINDELKNLGYPIGNITRALSNLEKERPMLIVQVRKENKKLARYKVTSEGLKVAKELPNAH